MGTAYPSRVTQAIRRAQGPDLGRRYFPARGPSLAEAYHDSAVSTKLERIPHTADVLRNVGTGST